MIRRERIHAGLRFFVLVGGLAVAGCGERARPAPRVEAQPWGMTRVAVAPALNFTGAREFDGNVLADLMASELSQVRGLEVLPVIRVLAVLAQQGRSGVESPAHAREIAERLGADGLLVFGVTEYDPYEPPVVGIAAQLYGSGRIAAVAGLDPVLVSRSPTAVPERPVASPDRPVAEAFGVYNAADESVAGQVKEFAESREAEESAFGWRKYLVSQRHYWRFCCQATIRKLLQCGAEPSDADPAPEGQVGRP